MKVAPFCILIVKIPDQQIAGQDVKSPGIGKWLTHGLVRRIYRQQTV